MSKQIKVKEIPDVNRINKKMVVFCPVEFQYVEIIRGKEKFTIIFPPTKKKK